jgi:hypothetical protein
VTDLLAEGILDSVLAAYRSFTTYEDSGLVLEDRLAVVAFRTRFQRGHLFEFSYANVDDSGRERPHSSLMVRDGKVTLETVLKGGPPLESLTVAVAALTGISRGSAHTAASLLLEEVGGWLPTDLVRPVRLPDQAIGGRDCYHVRGGHPHVASSWSLFVEKSTWLILQLIAHDKGPSITEYATCKAG